jgi:two-component system, chemotaxis family, chemotaxis protein CheY
MNVLSVDDSAMMRKIIRGAVDTLGFGFYEAADGELAINFLAKEEVDINLVLLDWNMPNLDGYETLKAIKANDKTKHIPVMMVTTEGEKTKILSALQAGAQNYLTKPFSQQDLLSRMMECLGMGLEMA